MMRGRQKSNKMKKKELQEKRNRPLPPPPKKSIVYSHHVEKKSPREEVEARFSGFAQRIALRLLDEKVEFLNDVRYHNNGARHISSAVTNLGLYAGKAIRQLSEWKAPSYNTRRCIAHLARHLYAKYYVPSFMDDVWYHGYNNEQSWFIHIGQGGNIRTVERLPVALTKKEAHYFLQAPKDFTPQQAFRFAQIINMGGKEPLVRQILKTRIATDYEAERNKFYYTIFAWLMDNPMLDTHHYAPIMDYIYNQKYEPFFFENGRMVAKQPNFCMKGRDPEALLKAVEQWHRQAGKETRGQFPHWSSCGRPGLNYQSAGVLHTITELLTAKQLTKEGADMHHCVASYAGSCYSGRVSIWSYETYSHDNGSQKKLTIEVDNASSTIRQARGKCNDYPTASDLYHLKLWAKQAGLTISKYLI